VRKKGLIIKKQEVKWIDFKVLVNHRFIKIITVPIFEKLSIFYRYTKL